MGIGDEGLRRSRVAAQWLDRRRRTRPAEVVRHLVGVQAQVLSGAGLGIRARAAGVTDVAVTSARVADRSVVLCWAMRGTLHLVTAEDHGRFVALLGEPHVARSIRRLRQKGVEAEEAWRGVRLIHRMLGREGPLLRAEVAARLRRRGVPTGGQAIAHLVWLAASDGTVCFGPDRGTDRTLVMARDWLETAPEPPNPEVTLADLALRYLRSHGPATLEDFVAWSGLRTTQARRAFRAIASRLREVGTPGAPRWSLASQRPAARSAMPLRLLPAFDEYLLGWRGRGFALPAAHAGRVNAGGGWIHPTVVDDGRVVGLWRLDRSRGPATLDLEPFGEVRTSAVAKEAGDLARFLGSAVEWDASPGAGMRGGA